MPGIPLDRVPARLNLHGPYPASDGKDGLGSEASRRWTLGVAWARLTPNLLSLCWHPACLLDDSSLLSPSIGSPVGCVLRAACSRSKDRKRAPVSHPTHARSRPNSGTFVPAMTNPRTSAPLKPWACWGLLQGWGLLEPAGASLCCVCIALLCCAAAMRESDVKQERWRRGEGSSQMIFRH